MKERQVYQFGEFSLDATAKVLFRGSQPVGLTRKAVETLLVLVEKGEVVGREPDVVRPDPNRFASVVLTPDSATLDDCNALWKMAGGVPSAVNPPLTIGYLVLLSPIDIDVDAVYTAEVGQRVAGAELEQPTGISIDVKRVPGKRVFVPAAFLAQFP